MKSNYNINNPMAPPWLMYPNISRYSIGWRMGYGENYMMDFADWYSGLNIDEQREFQEMFPEPKGWLGWYEEEYTDRDIYNENVLFWDRNGEMKYSREKVESDFNKKKKKKFIFFWGHKPSKDGTITKTSLSQWWKSSFSINIDTYCCMEQYMMAEKARLFKDDETLEKIMGMKNPKEIKELGRQVKNFDESIWRENRYSIILNGNYAKFMQNEDLRLFLISTKDSILVEASPFDKIWGIGMSANNENIEKPLLWRGSNLLGFALMEVRDELIRVCQNYDKLNMVKLHEKYD